MANTIQPMFCFAYPDGKRNTTNVLFAYPDGKCDKTNVSLVIRMANAVKPFCFAYPDGKRNKTNVFFVYPGLSRWQAQ